MSDRRDLTVGIDGDPKGFDRACKSAEQSARTFDRELGKVDAAMVATERTTARAAQLIDRYAKSNDKAALSAARLGVAAKEGADKAAAASVKAAEAAKKLERGEIDAAAAARLEARAERELEKAAIASAAAQLAAAKAAQANARGMETAAASQRRATTGMRGGLVSLIGAGVALVPPIAAATVALAAFAAVGAPSIVKVVKAQKNLAQNWGTLDRQQKVAAAGLSGLIGDYKQLAKAAEPTTMIAFNRAISTARQLLPQLGRTFTATAAGASDFLSQIEDFLTSGTMNHFLGFVRSNAPAALHELGGTFTQTGTLALNLVQDLAPMGMTMLHMVNGALSLVNALERVDPRLAEMAVTALALRAPTTALADLWTKGASKLGGLARGAEKAEGAAGKLSKTVGSSPNLYIGAALAVGYLGLRWATAKDSTDRYISSQKIANNAVGNNIAGWKAYAAALGKASVGQQTYNQNLASTPKRLQEIAKAGGYDPQKWERVKKAIDGANKSITNINQGAAALGKEFGLAAPKALQLAEAAGVDLSKGVLKSGKLTDAARAKFAQYEAAVSAASNPTQRIAGDMDRVGNSGLLMKDRVKALTDALDAYVKPALDAWNASTQLKQGYDDLAKALSKAKGDYSGNTAASRALRTALASQITTVSNLYHATLQQTGSAEKARATTARQLPILYAMAGGSKDARAQVDALAKTLVGAAGASNTTRASFLRTAAQMGINRSEALRLWAAYQKLPASVRTNVTTNADSARARINAVKSALDRLQDKTINITTYYRQVDIANRTSQANRGDARGGGRTGGLYSGGRFHYATGGEVSGLVTGPGTGTSDQVPAPWLSNKEFVVNSAATARNLPLLMAINSGGVRRGMDTGVVIGGGGAFGVPPPARPAQPSYTPQGAAAFAPVPTTPVDIGSLLQQWDQAVQPATRAQVDAAKKARRTQLDQMGNARRALRRAEHLPGRTHAQRVHRADAIASAERRIAKERRDLTDATRKLHDVEKRYQFSRQTPAQKLGNALALGIKNNAAFIKNLETLADRGFGQLAQQLLATGGPEAEKIAASAVKMSNKQLAGLQGQLQQAKQQQDTLTHLPHILSLKSALKGGASSWDALLQATGMAPNDLAATLKLMTGELSKTPTGRALLDQLRLRGYAEGGEVTGPPGIDKVPIMATAGEFLVKAGPAAANRQYLDAINRGAAVHAPAALPVRGGDGASVMIPITVHARDGQSAIAVAKATSYELGWALKSGASR